MNTDNGALSFESTIDNAKLNKAIEEAAQKIKGFTDTAVKGGEQIDDAFKVTAENISIQKDVIGQLEGNLKALNAEIGKMAPGAAQAQLKKEAAAVTAELEAEKQALTQLEKEVKKNEQAHVSYRTQLRDLRDEMIRMEQAGQRNSDAYRQLQERAGQLADAVGDAQTQMRIMADDQRLFKGIISTVTGMAGAFSAAQGAIGMFSGENENLQKIMLKVQSLMAITIGLQQVSEMLNKDSYFSLVMLTKAKNLFAVANMKVATALGISTVAAKALMATLTLGLSVAITAIVFVINKLVSASAEAKKKMEEFNKAVVDAAAKPLAALNELSVGWSRLGDNMQDKAKFVEQNADKFKELGVNINNVNDAERVFSTEGQEAIKNALIARAKAFAAVEMATEKYRESLKKQLELEKMPEKMNVGTTQYHPVTGRQISQTTRTVDNPARAKIENEIKKIEADGDALFEMSEKFKDQEKELITGLGLSSSNIIEGSLKAVEDSIAKLKEQYRNASNDTDRAELLKQIREQEQIRDRMDILSKREKAKENNDDQKEREKAQKEFNDAQREAIKRANDEELKLRRAHITDKKELIDFDLEQELKAIDELEKAYKEKASAAGIKDVDASAFESTRKALQAQAEFEKLTYENQMLSNYSSFLSKKLELEKQFESDRKVIQARIDLATSESEKNELRIMLNNRKKAVDDEVKRLQSEILNEGGRGLIDLYFTGDGSEFIQAKIKEVMPLFENIAYLTNNELNKLKDIIDDIEFSPEQLETFRQAGIDVEKLNAALKDVKHSASEAVDEAKWKNVLELAKKLASSMAELGGALEGIGGSVGQIGSALKGLSGQVDNLSVAFSDTATAQDKAMAGVSALSSMISMIGGQIAANKRAQEEWNAKIVDAKHQMALLRIEAQGRMSQNIFGVENPYAKAISGAKEYAQATKELHNATAALDMGRVQTGTKKVASGSNVATGAAAGAVLGTIIPGVGNAVGAGIGALVGGIVGLATKKTVPVFKSLKEKYGEVVDSAGNLNQRIIADYAKLDNATKKLVDNWQEIKAKQEEAQEKMRENFRDLAGDLGTSLSDALVDAFSNGDLYSAIDKFDGKMNDVISNIVSQLIFSSIFGQMFDDLEARFNESFGEGGDQSLVDDLLDFNENYKSRLDAYNQAMLIANEEMARSGLAGFQSKNGQSGLSGAISKTVTEETATLLSGYINAIRINQIEAVDVQRNALLALNQISSNTAHLVQMRDVVALLKQMNDAWATRSHGL